MIAVNSSTSSINTPNRSTTRPALLVLAAVLMVLPAFAQDGPAGEPGRETGTPNPLNNVYFGEQHLHTQQSADAFSFGTRNTPDDAYRYCKGEAIKKNTSGTMVQRITPYDWCAVTDHAVFFGMLPLLLQANNPLKDTPIGKAILSGDKAQGEAAFNEIIGHC